MVVSEELDILDHIDLQALGKRKENKLKEIVHLMFTMCQIVMGNKGGG